MVPTALELRLRNGGDEAQIIATGAVEVRRDTRSPLADTQYQELHDTRMWA